MVSLRKRHSTSVEKDEPVRTSPVTLDAPAPAEETKTPPPTNSAADASPPPELRDPVKEAGQKAIALQLRLREMENAEHLRNEAASQQQPQQQRPTVEEPQQQQVPTAEEIIANCGLPDNAKMWLRAHPEYVTDFEKNKILRKMHNVAEWQSGGQEYTDLYFDKMNVLLGLKQEAQPAPAPRAAPARRPAYVGSFSAPPTREAPSMKTGRPLERQPQLSREELEVAQNSGISAEEYARQKAKWEAMKRACHQDGRDR
jgi:hypothetical protein